MILKVLLCFSFGSLGSTRFLKVAQAKTAEGQLVVKVFVIHDPTLSLKPYSQQSDGMSLAKSNLLLCDVAVLDHRGLVTILST